MKHDKPVSKFAFNFDLRRYMKGQIGSLRLYRRALSADEIAVVYRCPAALVGSATSQPHYTAPVVRFCW